jgi:hypothetical protein
MRRRATQFAPAALVLLLACGGSDSFTPTEETVAGTLTGQTVTFNQTADTFIEEAEFIAGRNTLTAEDTFNGLSVLLQLVKAD